MRATWAALHSDLVRSANRLRFQTAFSRMSRDYSALHGLRDSADLMDHLHSAGGDPATRNDILRALVIAAQDKGGDTKVATTLLVLALWPGLDAVHGRLCRYYPNRRNEMAAEILGRVTLAILHLDLTAVDKIAATLVMNTQRDIHRAFKRLRDQGRDQMSWDDASRHSVAVLTDEGDERLSAQDWRQRLLPFLGRDTDLFLRIMLLGETQAEAGKVLGLSYAAARKRHQRALARLPCRKDFSATCPIAAQQLAFGDHGAANLPREGGRHGA